MVATHICTEKQKKKIIFVRWKEFHKFSSQGTDTKEVQYKRACVHQICNRLALRNRDNLNLF